MNYRKHQKLSKLGIFGEFKLLGDWFLALGRKAKHSCICTQHSECKRTKSVNCAPHQWRSDSVLKIGRLEEPGSIPGRAFRFCHSGFSLVFYKIRVNMGQDSLEKPARREQDL